MEAPSAGGGGGGGVLALAWRRYNGALRRRPLRTKALTSAAVAAASDALAQRLVGGPYRPRRTALMALFGLLWSGPSAHFWQAAVERAFGPTRGLGGALKKARACAPLPTPFAAGTPPTAAPKSP